MKFTARKRRGIAIINWIFVVTRLRHPKLGQKPYIRSQFYMSMKLIYLSLPVIILLDVFIWTWVAGLLTAPSDLSVFAGVVCILILLITHYLLYKFLKSKVKI